MRYTGEYHLGKHELLITKELFDRVQEVLDHRSRVHSHHKNPFPFLGLATCALCGCSITAERKKGHHYYRCTKKRGRCPSKYLREEAFVDQIRAAVAKVALPDDSFQFMMAEWVKDQASSSQPVAEMKAELAKRVPEIQVKLDRLLDAHIEGLIDKAEFLTKKETLLKAKVDLEEKLKQLEQGATGWLGPLREFLEAAHSVGQVLADGNLESLKEKAKKSGSNFRLAAKTLQFDYRLSWRLLAAATPGDNMWAM